MSREVMTGDSIGLLIPKGNIGRVIGKGGSSLKQIRESSGCQLQVVSEEVDYGAGNRRLNLIGTREQICIGAGLVIKKAYQDNVTDVVDVSIRIPHDWAGRAVGKGGENLWRIREEFSVRVQVEREPIVDSATGSEERLMKLSGPTVNMPQVLLVTLGARTGAAAGGALKGLMPGTMATLPAHMAFGHPLMAGLPGMSNSLLMSPQHQLLLQQQQLMMMAAGSGSPYPATIQGGFPTMGAPQLMLRGPGGYPQPLGAAAGATRQGAAGLGNSRPVNSDPDQMQLHFIVPGALAGAVLGPGGAEIKKTAQSSGCRMSMTARNGIADRHAVIVGTYQQCAMAQQLLTQQLADAAGALGQKFDEVNVMQLVPKDAAGAVIGKGGAMLKQLRDQSGASILLKREEMEGHRPCMITGTPHKVLQAERLVFELCKSATTKGGSLNL